MWTLSIQASRLKSCRLAVGSSFPLAFSNQSYCLSTRERNSSCPSLSFWLVSTPCLRVRGQGAHHTLWCLACWPSRPRGRRVLAHLALTTPHTQRRSRCRSGVDVDRNHTRPVNPLPFLLLLACGPVTTARPHRPPSPLPYTGSHEHLLRVARSPTADLLRRPFFLRRLLSLGKETQEKDLRICLSAQQPTQEFC